MSYSAVQTLLGHPRLSPCLRQRLCWVFFGAFILMSPNLRPFPVSQIPVLPVLCNHACVRKWCTACPREHVLHVQWHSFPTFAFLEWIWNWSVCALSLLLCLLLHVCQNVSKKQCLDFFPLDSAISLKSICEIMPRVNSMSEGPEDYVLVLIVLTTKYSDPVALNNLLIHDSSASGYFSYILSFISTWLSFPWYFRTGSKRDLQKANAPVRSSKWWPVLKCRLDLTDAMLACVLG